MKFSMYFLSSSDSCEIIPVPILLFFLNSLSDLTILETARKKGDFNMAEAASYKIKAHLKIESTIPPFDFLDLLLKDYNYLSTK